MKDGYSISAIIAAAGSARRMGCDKLELEFAGESVLVHTVRRFYTHKHIDEVIVVTRADKIQPVKNELEHANLKNCRIVVGAQTRGQSSALGIKSASGDIVLIHDGARPFVSEALITRVIDGVISYGAAAAALPVTDTVKKISTDGFIQSTVDRETLAAMQTPQGFKRNDILRAYEAGGEACTDDCAAAEKSGIKIKTVEGSRENIKLTLPEDIAAARRLFAGDENMRVGTGFDTHRLEAGRELYIGGVRIPHTAGLLGHSDADVLLHAIIDALFGAAALGDIGTHFPDSDERYRGISSVLLLKECGKKLRSAGYEICNIDSTVIAQRPKLAPYVQKMRESIAAALDIEVDKVSVKAKTNENMGFTGRGEGMEARAAVMIK